MIRVLLAILLVALGASGARATPDEANKLAATANELAGRNLFKEAAAKFAEAYRADPSRNELFCNIGISYYKADVYARAHLLLKLCLDRTKLEKQQLDAASALIATMEDSLRSGGHALVSIKLEPKTTAIAVTDWGPEESFTNDRIIWLPIGTWHLSAKSDGFEPQTVEVKIEGTQAQDIQVTMKRIPAPPPNMPLLERRYPSKIPAIIGTVVTVGLIVTAGIGFKKGHDVADASEFAIDREAVSDDRKEIKKWNTVMVLTGVGALVTGTITGVLWSKALKGSHVELAPTQSGASVSYLTRF